MSVMKQSIAPARSATVLSSTIKQPATGSRGMITSNHPLASLAGTEMLIKGGNAVDAAIATMFALSVVEPMMTTIFGAGFINMRLADGECITIDNYATVPAGASATMFEPIPDNLDNDVVGDLNNTGYLAVATGGTLLGWAHAVKSYGRLNLASVVAPAARYAREGFQVSQYLNQIISDTAGDLRKFPATAAVFLPDGKVPGVGDTIFRTDYASTLEKIGQYGPEYLYSGTLGQAIADDMAVNGGIVTLKDIEDYEIHERQPVQGTYRGYEIVSMAPPSSGGTHIIQMLNILEHFDVKSMGFGTADTIHLLAESMKLAFADRFEHMADPTSKRVPIEYLTSKSYSAEVARSIDFATARQYTASTPTDGESSSTTHCSAMDSDGNVVSTTQTLNGAFGSKVTVPGTGMLLNNCMHLMDPTPGRTNSIEPGKRILSSMSPTIVLKDGQPVFTLGTPGGVRIFGTVLQGIVNVIDHGMTLQQAVEAPRMWDRGPVLELEEGFDSWDVLARDLNQRGHDVERVFKVAGGMNGISFDPDSRLMEGAACWRADGAPIGLSGGDALVSSNPDEAAMWV